MKEEVVVATNRPTLKAYSIGFVSSLLLTLSAFILTEIQISSHPVISQQLLIPLILGLAFIQLTVQMIFFLHLWHEEKPRWNLLFFGATFSLILLVIVASIWIMQHLNYNMTPSDMTKFLIKDEGIHY